MKEFDVYDLLLNVRALVLSNRWPTVILEDCEALIESTDSDTVPDILFCEENSGRYETN